MCLNFGVSEADITEKRYGYSYLKATQTLKCKRCNQTGKIYSNPSILNAFHICLSQSYPFSSCPDNQCDNHSINIFDEPPGKYKKGSNHYHINSNDDVKKEYQARCSKCRRSFMLSPPLAIHNTNKRNWRDELDLFLKLVVNQNGPSNIMNILCMHPDNYYSRFKLLANQMQIYNNYHLAEFMKYKIKPQDETVSLYTDCIVTSLKVLRKQTRVHNMKIIVTTMKKNNRSLILAAHPMFDDTKISHDELEHDWQQPLTIQDYAYLKHLFNTDEEDGFLGLDGYYMQDHYVYMGHFLTVRKLLSQVKNIRFYIDGEKPLYNSALLAFSDKIKAKHCDIVVVKSDKSRTEKQKEKTRSAYDRAKKAIQTAYMKASTTKGATNKVEVLRPFDLECQMKKVNAAIKKTSNKQRTMFEESLASVHRDAIHHPNDKGKQYWVKDPLADKDVSGMRLLWLTRDETRMNTQDELCLYVEATLFFVDTYFNALRARSAFADRPGLTASGGRGYVNKAELPIMVVRDIKINVAYWNFFQRYRAIMKKDIPIAYEFGINKYKTTLDFNEVINFKYDFKHTTRMSK